MSSKLIPNTGATSDGNWQNWTPTWTNLTVGNGTVVSRFRRTGKFIEVFVRFTLGSTSSITGSFPTFTLPVNSAYTSYANGIATLSDANGSKYLGWVWMDTSSVWLGVSVASLTYVYDSTTSATVPFTWTSTDSFTVTMNYEVV